MRQLLILFTLLIPFLINAQTTSNYFYYNSIDTCNLISFNGKIIIYNGDSILLGTKNIFIDGNLSDVEADKYPYVFNDFNKAAKEFVDGTPDEPMRVFIAPYVYWIDNPDDPEVRVGKDGREPFGLIVKCNNLHLIGLNPDPHNVVLAAARGQTQGAIGNFTMFDFWGDGLLVKNLTMGNYCNVDLVYPLKKELERKKRMSAITQAHVAYCHGDRIVADNVRFISRLNMNPLNGAKRILFNNCHMESTDDALTGTGVYLNCTLYFYGQRPFWRSDMSGAVFLNCDFYVKHDNDRHYFCKSVGPLSIVDCRYHVNKPVYAGWTHTPSDWLRCYQFNVNMNGQPYVIGAEKPYNTICMDQLDERKAYRIEKRDSIIYNTYNLLRGEDNWDPLNVKDIVAKQSRKDNKDYSNMATCLTLLPLTNTIQTGKEDVLIKAEVKRHAGYILNNVPVKWKVQAGYEKYVKLSCQEGYECKVIATNHEDETKRFTVIAYTDDGLECASELTVVPDFINPPTFEKSPTIKIVNGMATVNYLLDLNGRKDESIITWYRCIDEKAENKFKIAVSRLDMPKYYYTIRKEDVGYYIMAVIEPKHLRSIPGKAVKVITKSNIKSSEVTNSNIYETDFSNFPTDNQPLISEGLWTVGGYKPMDTSEYDWQINSEKNYWIYGEGMNGSKGTGLLQDQKGARLLFTPLKGKYDDMCITLNVDASKTAGQGFGSATGQYLDIFIKYDTRTLTGYGLRIIRTVKYSNAVDFVLMKYNNGISKAISNPVSAICYRTNTTIHLNAEGNRLTATVSTKSELPLVNDPNLKDSVSLTANIVPNEFGGMGIQHTGSCGESTTMLHYLKIKWQ